MKNEATPQKRLFKNTALISVFVISIVVFGVSVSYAFYTANLVGSVGGDNNTGGNLNVTTTLTTTSPINAAKLALIEAGEYLTKAEKVEFSVTNHNDSNVKAKYTVKLVEMSLSKNLFSKYFKWTLIINSGTANEKVYTGNFADAAIASEGTSDTTLVTNLTKELISDGQALVLDINKTDNIAFYIWLENDNAVDQLYLTNGNFSGKLSLDAVPTR